ncbi:MAG: helix-hairpin-helix domain-containing protein [Bacillota bacterium]|nr:helix-hairpin-helix domain-containing protein [Bacillota bacterium]
MKEWFKTHKLFVFVTIIIVVAVTYYFYENQPTSNSIQVSQNLQRNVQTNANPKEEKTKKGQQNFSSTIMVDIKGEVKSPGVYPSNQGERVIDVIKRAGGLTEKADDSGVNFAQHVQDEMIIYIPGKGEIISQQAENTLGEKANQTTSSKVNINKADESQLETLPGVGPSKAQAIISYREEKGFFKSVEDLKEITGIGDKTFEKLKESITVK